ncbi:MAG: prepilin-type N-terminal cleavage/methylation domain-containing protein [Holosporales bacterium]|jgi:prepilin-type N-terminal cleavage/methylation domain-containing protein|nr:prepilin-type N-terminal cleavage/methylation domain-containing protein [Holosporales bacterium]
MKNKAFFAGFSLLEVSISLVILGIISTIGISQLNLMNKIYTAQKTQSNIDFVVKSIAAYCIAHDFKLPFPAEFSNNTGLQSDLMKDSFGMVPFKSLGIMEKFARNGKGQWLSYKMNPFFGKPSAPSGYKTLGVLDFSSEIPGDKIAFIIKSQNDKEECEMLVWYSEKNFISNFIGGGVNMGLINTTPVTTPSVITGIF